jgi:hypothetical protein
MADVGRRDARILAKMYNRHHWQWDFAATLRWLLAIRKPGRAQQVDQPLRPAE